MDDLISRQAAIDAILAVTGNSSVRELYEHVQEHELSEMWSGGVNAAIDIIIAVPSAQEDSKELSFTHKALDCISRQDAIDALTHKWDGMVTSVFDVVKSLPSAQPQIIRCKGCKHQVKEWREDKRFKNNGYYACGCDVVGDACGYWALLGQDDDYCSMAERKGNG